MFYIYMVESAVMAERPSGETDPVSRELDQAKKVWGRGSGIYLNSYLEKLIPYLEFAQECHLSGENVVLSCRDLARLIDPEFKHHHKNKIQMWQQVVAEFAPLLRPTRVIPMKLDPEYFAGILAGVKTYEGRAWDPASPKNYADLRPGDLITFSVNQERLDWEVQCQRWSIDPRWQMSAQISEIFFAPTIHYLYQFIPGVDVGAEFQPYKQGVAELIQLGRASVYYGFPRYPRLIEDHGFLGIKLQSPVLV